MNAKQIRETAMYILGVIIVVAVVWILALLTVRPMPIENKDALMLALGTLLAAFGTVVGYFYGSSKGSADKNDALASKGPEKPA
jgi:hypothetical protein